VKPVLEIENLAIRFPTRAGLLHAARGVSFSLSKGETLALVGESGCGKTSVGLAVMGLLPKHAVVSADRLEIAGTDIRGMSQSRLDRIRGSRVAMVFQNAMSALNPTLKVGTQLVEVMTRHTDCDARTARARAISLLERMKVDRAAERLGHYPHQLSGGLRQRVMLAMALMCRPEVIIADEPTTALDVTVQAEVLALLKELQQELGLAVIFITHDLGVVSYISHRVAVMYAGEVVETGPTPEVIDNPAHPYSGALLASVPRFIQGPAAPRLGVIPGAVPSVMHEVTSCVFLDRCTMAADPCRRGPIDLDDAGLGRAVRCVRSPLRETSHPGTEGRTS